MAKYHHVLDSIESGSQIINEFAEKYTGMDSKEIFKELFGVEAVGEVEIKKAPCLFALFVKI